LSCPRRAFKIIIEMKTHKGFSEIERDADGTYSVFNLKDLVLRLRRPKKRQTRWNGITNEWKLLSTRSSVFVFELNNQTRIFTT